MPGLSLTTSGIRVHVGMRSMPSWILLLEVVCTFENLIFLESMWRTIHQILEVVCALKMRKRPVLWYGPISSVTPFLPCIRPLCQQACGSSALSTLWWVWAGLQALYTQSRHQPFTLPPAALHLPSQSNRHPGPYIIMVGTRNVWNGRRTILARPILFERVVQKRPINHHYFWVWKMGSWQTFGAET